MLKIVRECSYIVGGHFSGEEENKRDFELVQFVAVYKINKVARLQL